MINRAVLVLNQNYEPLNICRARRALVLVHTGKAEMLENGTGFVRSANAIFSIPSVIRLDYMIKRPRNFGTKKLSRYEIFSRDHNTCQYCGKQSHQLTLDHVMPRFRGGEHTWENVVSACIPCNRRKAGRTPAEAGMKLAHRPCAPHNNGGFHIPHNYLEAKQEWQKYLPRMN
ncbi:MAG: HNH endonuclease [Chloroflexi bacterium]|nr:HNH endonuclease [Chloroflexota bacterium]